MTPHKKAKALKPINKEPTMEKLVLELVYCDPRDFGIAPNDQLVYFCIAEQKGPWDWQRASNGIEFRVLAYPEFLLDTFFIRGSKSQYDNNIIAFTREQYERVNSAINEIMKRENGPKFIETITFLNKADQRRFKINVTYRNKGKIKGIDCDNGLEWELREDEIEDVNKVTNAF